MLRCVISTRVDCSSSIRGGTGVIAFRRWAKSPQMTESAADGSMNLEERTQAVRRFCDSGRIRPSNDIMNGSSSICIDHS